MTALLLALGVTATPAFAQSSTTITIDVRNFDTGNPVSAFTYLVNVDNTGDRFDPDPLNHPSLSPMASYSPPVAAGDQSTNSFTVAPGRYLISVRAPDFKLWGQHIRVNDDGSVTDANFNPLGTNITIDLTPHPLPLSRLVVYAFDDHRIVNGFPDFPAEAIEGGGGLQGFDVIIEDAAGHVTVDWFGNPLCTQYDGVGSSTPLGDPIPGTGGQCLTNSDGTAIIENIPLNRYDVSVIPPNGNAEDWSQTTTLEGSKVIDAWLEEGADGFGVPGEQLMEPGSDTAFFFGFAKRMDFGDPESVPPGTGTISGQAVNFVSFPPFEQLVVAPTEPVKGLVVALSDLRSDAMVARTRGDANGNFVFNNVPPGTYQLAFWDDPQDYIMGFRTVVIDDGEVIDMGDVGIFRWFGWVSGHVFFDNNQDALRDPGETGIPNQEVVLKFRDGSVHQVAVTDSQGFYEFDEARSPLGRMETIEVDFGRFARTGHSRHREQFALFNNLDPSPEVVDDGAGGGLILNQLTWEGRRSVLDWGKLPYQGTDNGGISGVVLYATTRNEFDARLAAAEDYEPGIPNVTVRLYSVLTDANGQQILDADGLPQTDLLLNEVQADAWAHPTDHGVVCDVLDKNGNVVSGPTPDFVAANCIEVPQVGNETQPGAYDGGWAFESICSNGVPLGAGCAEGAADEISPIPPGDYIVEVVPSPFYQILKEEDLNTIEGQELIPAFPPPPCVGPLHFADIPDEYGSPFDDQMMPLCSRKLVTLQAQQNAGAEFYLFTDSDTDGDATTRNWTSSQAVPPPARIFGLVEDDIVIQSDPNSITYGEPRGVPDIPVGIYEFNRDGQSSVGRHLITVYTDENGFYEALLPSTYTADCPTPAGVCPAMYIVLPNDPGGPNNPDPKFRTNYLVVPFVFEFHPGKMRHADTPIDPTNTLVCSVPPDAPQIFRVSDPVITAGQTTQLTITGMRFGNNINSPPTVTLDFDENGPLPPVELAVVTWTPATPFDANPVFEDVVVVEVPAIFPAGPAQLQVTSGEITGFVTFDPTLGPLSVDGGFQPSRNGLTIHLLGAGYNPPVVPVSPPADLDDPVIQNAILAAAPNSLILIEPGTYRENVIINKKVKLQGYGPGGIVGAGRVEPQGFPCPEPNCPPVTLPGEEPFSHIEGTVIDGRFFSFSGTRLGDWVTLLGTLGFVGPAEVPRGAAITWLAPSTGAFDDTSFQAQVDGLGITAGRGEASGGIYMHAYIRNMILSNNILESNQGGYGGALAVGQPLAFDGLADNENDNLYAHHNRFLDNGSTFRAGGIGIYNGATNYEFANNDICGNFSAEYGGGLSHFGFSPGAYIHDNRIYFNDAFDEGGGLLIGGEPDIINFPLGPGSGDVRIESNLIQANLSNDDGGGIRLLHPLDSQIDVVNNFIVNNIAADFGGGIAIDDASNVRIVNNSVVGNMSTHTSEDAILGEAHGAGLLVELNSFAFQATLPPGAPEFSNPLLFNNIFFDNLAYRWDEVTPQDTDLGPFGLVPTAYIDFEVFGGDPGECLDPTSSFLTVPYGPDGGACTTTDPSNIVGEQVIPDLPEDDFENDPMFKFRLPSHQLEILAPPNRLDFNQISLFFDRPEGTFVGYTDYHLLVGSPAIDAGAAVDPRGSGVVAPFDDIDDDIRPLDAGFDMGADETSGASPGPQIFFSTAGNVAIPGVAGPFDDADVYAWDGTFFSRVFDAQDEFGPALPANADIDALWVLIEPGTEIFYMSFNRNTGTNVPGVGVVDDSDVVKYDAITNSWSLFFDGSAVGLTTNGEDVDAFEFIDFGVGGAIVVSTSGTARVNSDSDDPSSPEIRSRDESLLVFIPDTDVSDNSRGTWAVFFDGGEYGLNDGNNEDVDGVHIDEIVPNPQEPPEDLYSIGDIALSTNGNFTTIDGLTGQGNDVFVCGFPEPFPVAADSCDPFFDIFFDGDAVGIPPNQLDAFDIPDRVTFENETVP